MPMTSEERQNVLAAMKDDGLTFYECVAVFGRDATDPYVREAKRLQVDGAVEVDDVAVVSEGSDNGAYVMAWLWVETSDCHAVRFSFKGKGEWHGV